MGYDYNYGYYDNGGFLAAFLGIYFLVILFLLAIVFIAHWKLFTKAGEEGWKGIVPFLNAYTLTKLIWGNGWFFLITFASMIPFIGWIVAGAFYLISSYRLARAFGKDALFTAGLIFLPFIFLLILAFGDAKYMGVPSSFGGHTHPDAGFQGGIIPSSSNVGQAPQNGYYGANQYGYQQQNYQQNNYQQQNFQQQQNNYQQQNFQQGYQQQNFQQQGYQQQNFQQQPYNQDTDNQNNNQQF